ncbi:hypothetical protein PV11_09917 [Exophiala sideris]|uniref:Uncharacterized protein n=1 Tax=Exophiala sideris TaxID=1016849 RepID=A0A0D1YBI5_9EURO|nr:hypothetical protein PV11_09917 [Exophiala sideris]
MSGVTILGSVRRDFLNTVTDLDVQIESMHDVVGRYGDLSRAVATATQLVHHVKLQRAIIFNTIGTLCRGAGIPPNITGDFDLRAQQDAEEKLNTYLGGSYDHFFATLKEITQDLCTVRRALLMMLLDASFDSNENRLLRLLKDRRSDGAASSLISSFDCIDVCRVNLEKLLANIVVSKGYIRTFSDTAQAIARAAATHDPNDVDRASINTMRILKRDEISLPYLTVSLSAGTNEGDSLLRSECAACLDTGAAAYFVSEELSKEIGIEPKAIPREEFTLANGQTIWLYAMVKLVFSWGEDKKDREKHWFYVMPGLITPLVLPNDFISRHEDIFMHANRGPTPKRIIATIGFPRRGKTRKEEDEKQASEVRRKN